MRWLISIGLSLATNAVALLIAAALLDNFKIDARTFVVAVVIFSLLSLLLRPILVWMVVRWVRPLVGVIGLVTTFLILLVTDVLSDGIQIEGTTTWLAATVIVWLGTVVFELLDGPLRRRFVRAT